MILINFWCNESTNIAKILAAGFVLLSLRDICIRGKYVFVVVFFTFIGHVVTLFSKSKCFNIIYFY